jgi:alkylation response protein AidB-like acyl-CoA dehydrogenase
MNKLASDIEALSPQRDIVETADLLGRTFAARASAFDEDDCFATENFRELRKSGLIEAGVPSELGGGGAEPDELALMLRTLARHCGSTALALAVHTHNIAVPAWRWRHQKVVAVEPLLRRVAAEKIILVTSGGSDWVAGSGEAVKVEGGYRITARKIYSSASHAGDILMTGAILKGEGGEPEQVLHFGIPLSSPNVRILDTWHTMGMRATGSHDVAIDGHVVPEAAVAFKRKAGEWHPVFQIIATIALPLIYSVYLGVAESARGIAVVIVGNRRSDRHITGLVGRMDTELMGARNALSAMLDVIRENAPSADSVNRVMMGRTLAARHVLAAVELAMEAAGGQSYYRKAGLERCFRDIQGARFHPMQAGPQAEYAGSMALGLPVDRLF